MKNPRPRLAFTIIELMMAIAIFAGVMAAIYACWSAVVRGTKLGLSAAADVQRERVARRAVEDSLNSVVMYVANQSQYAFIADTSGDYAYLSFVSRLPPSFPGSGMFGDLRLRRVTFSVEPDTNSTLRLVMTQAPVLLATNETQEPYSLVLAKNVTQFRFQFWATNAGTAEWVDEWLLTNQLPSLIQYGIAFDSTPPSLASGVTRRPPQLAAGVVAPPAVAVLEPYQMPGGRGAAGGGTPRPGPNTTPPGPGGVSLTPGAGGGIGIGTRPR
jgi:prepilin-type N-terminal cleavage/methylation domain-containing protein